ncbi:MAG TPA: hypothetical protein VGE51_13820 [Fontimonas sp.]
MTKTWLALGIAAAIAGCSDDKADAELRCETPTAVAPAINEPFNVQVGDSVVVDGGLRLQFVAVDSESRCPTGVECVSAGSVVVSLRAQAYDRDEKSFTLETGADSTETVAFDNGFYQVELKGVEPYPVAGREIAADGYCASFSVAKALE